MTIEEFDCRSSISEVGCRVLGAWDGSAFPQDQAGVEQLIRKISRGESGPHSGKFRYEASGQLPRFLGEDCVWLSPAGEGRLKLRVEVDHLVAVVADLAPDGWLGEPSCEEGFGVDEIDLTDQARSDRAAVERYREEKAESDMRDLEWSASEQLRFATESLRLVCEISEKLGDGTIITWLSLYEEGVIVSCICPKKLRGARSVPAIWLSDDRATTYQAREIVHQLGANGDLRASIGFGPGVPSKASKLVVQDPEGNAVRVDLSFRNGPR